MPNEIMSQIGPRVSGSAEGVRASVQSAPVQELPGRQTVTETGGNLPAQQGQQAPDRAQLDEAVSRIQDHVQNLKRELQFSVDQESGRTVITVIDSKTDEVIRQIPPEELLALARQLSDAAQGVLLHVQA